MGISLSVENLENVLSGKVTERVSSEDIVWLAWRYLSQGSAIEEICLGSSSIPESVSKKDSYLILVICRNGESLNVNQSFSDEGFTPRGLQSDISSCFIDEALNPCSGPTYALYTWNGLEADVSVKACALSKGFQLNRRLRWSRPNLENLFMEKTIKGGLIKKLALIPSLALDGNLVSTSLNLSSREYRTQLSEILPGKLFLSSQRVASDEALLKSQDITHIVNLTCDKQGNPIVGMTYLCIPLLDVKTEDLLCFLPTIFAFLENSDQEDETPVKAKAEMPKIAN